MFFWSPLATVKPSEMELFITENRFTLLDVPWHVNLSKTAKSHLRQLSYISLMRTATVGGLIIGYNTSVGLVHLLCRKHQQRFSSNLLRWIPWNSALPVYLKNFKPCEMFDALRIVGFTCPRASIPQYLLLAIHS